METKTIEERASNVVHNVFHKEFWNDKVDADMRQIKNLMVEFAAEQDKIAREEQREIDIQRAVRYYCKHCCGHCDNDCTFRNNLIKAIKGE